jgi:Flp pilus assembly protein TadG
MSRCQGRSKERGSSVIDFPFVLIFFIVMLWAIFQFGFLFTLKSALSMAAENGARAALQYQPASSIAEAEQARAANAQNVTEDYLSWLRNVNVQVKQTPCSYNQNLACFTVTASYPYGEYPLVPPLLHFPIIGAVGIPQTLSATATIQADPNTLLAGGG